MTTVNLSSSDGRFGVSVAADDAELMAQGLLTVLLLLEVPAQAVASVSALHPQPLRRSRCHATTQCGTRPNPAAVRRRARPGARARARVCSAKRAAAACTAGSSRCDGSTRAGFSAQPLAQAAMSGSAP